jgi:hypothetical protein
VDVNRINIFRIDKGIISASLTFREGQVLKGKVISTNAKEITLKIGAVNLKAQAEVYVKSGQTLNLLVESIKQQFIKLKIINDDYTILKPEESILKVMGLSPSKELVNIIKELVKFQLPLDVNTINYFNSFYRQNMPHLVSLAIWLMSLNIEGDLKNLSKLFDFFTGRLNEQEEALFFKFLNEQETRILGNYNIFGWSIFDNYLYMLTQNSKGSKISPEQCFLVLKLKSRVLGELWFKVDYKNANLKVDIICADDKSENLIKNEIFSLERALNIAGYKNISFLTRVEKVKTVLDFIPGPSAEDVSYINYHI